MMKRLALLMALIIALACGGGGSGGPTVTAIIVGRVLDVSTGGPVSPAATVQVGSSSVQTASDGSFQLTVPQGSTSLSVDAGSEGLWTFTYAAADGTTDVGDLWVGPSKVTVTGRVLDASNGLGVKGALVSFAGRSATTNAAGTFVLQQVAYSSQTQTAFWGIKGTVKATNYFTTSFSAQPNTASGGVVTVNDILMTRTSTEIPPDPPYNIYGSIAPSAEANGTIVTLKLAGTPVRIYNVGSTGQFYFWVEPGTYTLEAVHGGKSGTADVTVDAVNSVVRQDVTLN